MLVGPDVELAGADVLGARLDAVDLQGAELCVVVVGEGQVGDGALGLLNLLDDGAGGVLLGDGGKGLGSLVAGQDGGLEGGAGAGAGLALDDLNLAGGAADLGPVGDGTGEDALELLGGEVGRRRR